MKKSAMLFVLAGGLMAGYGLQLWPILQDMSQLGSAAGRC